MSKKHKKYFKKTIDNVQNNDIIKLRNAVAEKVGGRMGFNTDRQKVRELIVDFRAGDQKAFGELLEMYSPLIEASVAKYAGTYESSADIDDLRQEATVVFYNSVMTYELDQNEVEFGLYAKICITNALISQLRAHKKHESERLSDSLSDDFFAGDSEDPLGKILEQESIKALYSVIRKNLSDFEYRVWQLYMSGRSAREIGELVGKGERSVSNAIYRIRVKLRETLR